MATRLVFAAAMLTFTLGAPALVFGETPQPAGSQQGQRGTEAAGPLGLGEDQADAAGIKVIDALAVRPVSLVSALFSAGAFVLTLPFAAIDPAIEFDQASENLVEYPFGYTFTRPLGDFSGPSQ